jgi:hypothetical protein
MTFSNLRTMMATAMLGAGLMSLTTASAEEPGVVRISDGIKRISAQKGEVPLPLPAEVTGENVESNDSSAIHAIPEGTIIYEGRYQNYPPAHDGHHHHPSCWDRNALPPDYGFYPPTPYPYIWRQPVIYQRYLPDQPYGTPGMRYSVAKQPMVYMPTDTTQLGFNYMYVPQWLPNRNNYPLAPNPVMWQRREVPWPKWEDPYRAKHKHFHFGKNEQDLMPGPEGPRYLPYQRDLDDDDVEEIEESISAPAPDVEAAIETDAQI